MNFPVNYASKLNLVETQLAIKLVKDTFERKLAVNLNLMRVSAPLMVVKSSGLNDDLNGVERPIQFDVPALAKNDVQIVHSLAKWKRMALGKYGIKAGNGLYTDMNAVRRDEDLDNLHSIYVDQWDWEKTINKADRNIEFLKETVTSIIKALKETQDVLLATYPELDPVIEDEHIDFITTQQLLDLYPDLNSKERENAFLREHHTAFIMQIGDVLSNGQKHDGRAPDYDDWQLNGDIMVYNKVLDMAFELSSMGIRVDATALKKQLEKADCIQRSNLPFHRALLNNDLPLSMGGGIGQSRLCMALLNKAHIGEVQASLWPENMIEECQKHNIHLL